MKRIDTDILIVGTGAAGLFAALHADPDKKVLMITKVAKDKSDSYLAQGGICVLKDESDYDSFFEDTMKAGHYENRRESVDIMIRSSKETINELIGYGVEFTKKAIILTILEKDVTLNLESYIMKTLQEKKSLQSF